MKYFLSIFFCSILLLAFTKIQSQPIFPENGEVYRDDVVPRIDIQVNPDTLIWLYEHPDSDLEFHAVFMFDNGAIKDTMENVGFRLRGNTSRYSAKKSFKVSFNSFESGRKYNGLEKMNLNGEHNDPTISRAKICWDMLRESDIPAPRSNHVKLYINNNYHGLYLSVEHIDEEFAESRFGNKDGNLYKCLYPADLKYLGNNPDVYKYQSGNHRAYDLKTNTADDDYSDLANFIAILNNTPLNDLPCKLEEVFNVQDYLKIMAFDVFTANWDGYIFNNNNFYLYHNTKTGKFEYVVYDPDNTFGIDWFGIDWSQRDVYEWSSGERPLYTRIMQVQKYRNQYSKYIKELSDFTGTAAYFPYMYSLRDKIYPFVLNDPFYPLDYGYDISDFTSSYNFGTGDHVPQGLTEYITGRRTSLIYQLVLNNIYPVLKYLNAHHSGVNQPVAFNVFAKDDGANLVVKLSYTVNADLPVTFEQMFDDGNHGDGAAGDNIYGVFLDGYASSTTILYTIQATDNFGKMTEFPCDPATLIIPPPYVSGLYINEFMASNETSFADESGDFDDWIEIYNGGTSPVWMGDKYLTDNLDNPDKWQFPDITIPEGEFMVVWADEDEGEGPLHTSFKLSAGGEEIGIFDNAASGFATIDTYIYSGQTTDVSEGRNPDGGGEWKFYEFPTPGKSNLLSSLDENPAAKSPLLVFPNPASGGFVHFNKTIDCTVYNSLGAIVIELQNTRQIEVKSLLPGVYFISTIDGEVARFIILPR